MPSLRFTTVRHSLLRAIPNKEGSRVTERAKPPVNFFQTVLIHNFRLKIPLLLCRNVEVPRHVVATFSLVLHKASLNTKVFYCPEIFCNTDC